MLTKIIVLIVFIAFSAFFSCSETALFSLSNIRVKHLVEKGSKIAKIIEKLKSDTHKLLITILIGNNIVNIGASTYATTIMMDLFKSNAAAITTGIMTLVILTFGEITPKTLASTYSEKLSMFTAVPLYVITKILSPISWIFEKMTHKIVSLIGKKESPLITKEEIETYITLGQKAGQIKESEEELVKKVLKFENIDIKKIMTHKKDIVSISQDQNIDAAIIACMQSGHLRIPVYKDNSDKIIGFVYLKELLKAKAKNIPMRQIIRSIPFIPITKKPDELLHQFKTQKQNIAMVVDEYGAVQGVITMEDLLEQIVGDIVDETQKVKPWITKIDDKRYMVIGKTDFYMINKKLGLGLRGGNYNTISGFILNRLGRIPSGGEEINAGKCTFTVKKVHNNRIEDVEIKINQ